MGRISTFMQVSADGYFAGPNGEIDWFKSNIPDPEFERYSLERAQGNSTLLFGRVTYEMMAAAWPTDEAHDDQPDMADVMATSPKLVFSKSLHDVVAGPRWQNVEVMHDIDAGALRADGRNFTTLGSGSLVRQLTQLDLAEARAFKNGLVWLTYHRR